MRGCVARRAILLLLLTACGLLAPAHAAEARSADARYVAAVGHLDIEGGGMVDVQGGLAAIGHMAPPHATSLLDVSDPARPRLLARIPVQPGTHSHKARLCGSLLITNHERYGGGSAGRLGLGFFDVADPARPREIGFLATGGGGVHRFQADCPRSLVYAGAGADGYRGDIALIVDFSNPRLPREVGRWWLPGQWTAGGERAGESWARVHHANRMGDRLYVPLWGAGFAILDIQDLSRPRLVSHTNYPRPSGAPTHTALPVGHPIQGRKWLAVFDEDLGGGCERPAGMRMADITDERKPILGAEFQPPPLARCAGRAGSHQPHEHVGPDNRIYAAWFARGLRVLDIGAPARPTEIAHYVPRRPDGRPPLSNDVFVDGRGLIYLIDRDAGLDILRLTGEVERARPR
jgi:hypothetical protein